MNKVILMGRLTRDPEVRYTQTNNTMVATFSLAVNRRFVRQGEERQADFINIVAWSRTAEFVSKYFKKGQQVGVIAEETYFADSRRDGEGSSSFENTFGEMPNEIAGEASDFETTSGDDLPF